MKSRTKRRTAIIAMLIAVIMCFSITTTAFAIGSSFTWFEAVAPTGYESLGSLSPSNGIKFEGVAQSAESSTFTVKLQKQGLFIWYDVGNTYTITSDNVYRYSPRQGTYVNGYPFLLVWPTSDSGSYRLKLEVQSNPQAVGFYYVSVYTW